MNVPVPQRGVLYRLAAIAAVSLFATSLTFAATPADRHVWERIVYPMLPVPGVERGLTVVVGSGRRDSASHLRFDILWSAGPDDSLPAAIAEGGKITVRLHLPDGAIVLPEGSQSPKWWGAGNSKGMTHSLNYTFPWTRNSLDESWIEVVLPGQTYWVELPYGFTRNPSDPLLTDPDRELPVFPPTMKNLPANDRLVPWLHVNYDLGEIQNHWRVMLELANPFDAQAELVLYGGDIQIGKSMFLWTLETPKTTIEMQWPGGKLASRAVSLRLHEDGRRRSDEFKFSRESSPRSGRVWGTAVIKVDDQSYECVVPSSLFKYVHGTTDSGNRQRLPRPQHD